MDREGSGLLADLDRPRAAILGTKDLQDRSPRPPLALGSLWAQSWPSLGSVTVVALRAAMPELRRAKDSGS